MISIEHNNTTTMTKRTPSADMMPLQRFLVLTAELSIRHGPLDQQEGPSRSTGQGFLVLTAEPPRKRSHLLALPAEIRNAIYELTFTPIIVYHDDTFFERAERLVLLTDSRPPEKSLLLACRFIYREARSIYRKSYRDYWQSTPFCVRTLRSDLDDVLDERFCDEDLDRINSLDIEGGYRSDYYHFVFSGWRMITVGKQKAWVFRDYDQNLQFGFVDGMDYGGYKWRPRRTIPRGEDNEEMLRELTLQYGWEAPLKEQLSTIHERFRVFSYDDDEEGFVRMRKKKIAAKRQARCLRELLHAAHTSGSR